MKTPLYASISLMLLAVPALSQLPEGNYLVGTMGWRNSLPFDPFTTVQVIDPFMNQAQKLNITGVPKSELPGCFLILRPDAFLMGTKVRTSPAAGNVYRVLQQTGGGWKANKLNQSPLNINVSSMVMDNNYLYVTGSASFGQGATDAQIQRIARANGKVDSTYARFGSKFMKGGASGSSNALVMIGTDIHVFTWNSGSKPTANEHWVVSTIPAVTFKKLTDLPLSKRYAGRGFASSSALYDPVRKSILVVGRWGELQWRSASGKDLHYERWAGAAFATGNNYWDQMWRGACINHDTYAVAMSDHQFGAIDERRCGGQPSSMPVANNVCRASMVLGPDDILTISGMAHVPSSWSSYRLVADGCKESNETAPSSYALDHARAGNPFFALSLKTSSKAALLLLGSRVTMPVPGAPGCTLYTSTLNGWVVVAAPSGGRAVVSTPLPSGLKFKAMTQWMTLDVKANSLGIVLSDARELVIQ